MDDKQRLRADLLARRAALTAADLAAAEAALAVRAGTAVVESGARTVAAYLSFGGEPPTWRLLDDLREAGVRVLVPRALPERVLEWVDYVGRDTLVRGRFGIPEPAGAAGPEGLAAADLVFVPALAVDRAGFRLGRGGGYYDTALAQHPRLRRVALVYDHEVVDDTYPEPHDQRVDAIITPSRETEVTRGRV